MSDGEEPMMDGDDGEEGTVSKVQHAFGTCCLGIFLFPAMLFMLGWNEKNFVCTDAKILHAEADATEVPTTACGDAAQKDTYKGKFVYYSCGITESPAWTPSDFSSASLTASGITWNSPVGQQQVEFMQCQENKETKTNSQTKKTETYYTYSMGWVGSPVTTSFADATAAAQNCPGLVNGLNPATPTGVEAGTQTDYAELGKVKTGIFEIGSNLREGFTADTIVPLAAYSGKFASYVDPAAGTNHASITMGSTTAPIVPATVHVVGDYLKSCSDDRLGCARISYWTSSATLANTLTQIDDDGITQDAETPSSWGCSAGKMSDMRPGTVAQTKDEFIANLKSENQSTTWIIRIIGILGAWGAIYCCFSPIATAADLMGDCLSMIPCVGDMLENFVEGVVTTVLCVMSCGIGCSCALFVIALVWLAMRPLYGGIMMGIALLLCCLAIGVRQMTEPDSKRRREKAGQSRIDESDEES